MYSALQDLIINHSVFFGGGEFFLYLLLIKGQINNVNTPLALKKNLVFAVAINLVKKFDIFLQHFLALYHA